MASQADFLLPPSVLRNLTDRSFDKRRIGAVETEKVVRQLRAQGNRDAIKRIILLLAQDFAGGLNSNNRKGGLIGLASCAIALARDMDEYLDVVVPSVLKEFSDAESRVRYYACESLFNIAKVCRGAMVAFFNDIFSGLCKLVADVDQDCRNGAGLLDRLLKEIVLETPPAELQVHVATFVPLLKSHMAGTVNPYVRQTLIGWVVALDSVPGVDLLPHVHDILSGLFAMLADGNREVRSAAYTALAGFLDQLDEASGEEVHWDKSSRFLSLLETVMSYTSRDRDGFARLTAVEWLAHVLARPAMRAVIGPVFDSLASTLLRCMADAHGGSGAGSSSSSGMTSSGLGGGVQGDVELIELCVRANADLQELVRAATEGSFDAMRLVRTVTAEGFLCHPDRLTRSCALRWTGQLLVQCPKAVLAFVDSAADGGRGILDCLLRNLLDGSSDGHAGSSSSSPATSSAVVAAFVGPTSDADVLKLTLEVLARLAITDSSSTQLRTRVLTELVRLFASHKALLEGRAAFIVRRLCLLLEPRVVYLTLAQILSQEPNREFASLLVELLNLLLLTALELSDFRDGLRGCASADYGQSSWGSAATATTGGAGATAGAGSTTVSSTADGPFAPRDVFLSLYSTWVLNPVAALALCLLTQAYELADRIVLTLGEASVTLGLLMQVDKLVQLLESPVFLHTRMHLLRPEVGGGRSQAYLLRSLYGLLMLLPQGTAYATLKDRLQAVTNLHIATGGVLQQHTSAGRPASSTASHGVHNSSGSGTPAGSSSGLVDTEALFHIFAQSQAGARAALSADLRARSLLSSSSHGAGPGAGAAVSASAPSGIATGSNSTSGTRPVSLKAKAEAARAASGLGAVPTGMSMGTGTGEDGGFGFSHRGRAESPSTHEVL